MICRQVFRIWVQAMNCIGTLLITERIGVYKQKTTCTIWVTLSLQTELLFI